jgi:hypothetical protein
MPISPTRLSLTFFIYYFTGMMIYTAIINGQLEFYLCYSATGDSSLEEAVETEAGNSGALNTY